MIQKFSIAFLFLVGVLFLCSSCYSKCCVIGKEGQNESFVCDSTKGIIKDMSSLDGCRYMILLLKDSTFLNPMNLSSEYKADGKKICFSFEYMPAMPSICMKGKMVKIKEIRIVN